MSDASVIEMGGERLFRRRQLAGKDWATIYRPMGLLEDNGTVVIEPMAELQLGGAWIGKKNYLLSRVTYSQSSIPLREIMVTDSEVTRLFREGARTDDERVIQGMQLGSAAVAGFYSGIYIDSDGPYNATEMDRSAVRRLYAQLNPSGDGDITVQELAGETTVIKANWQDAVVNRPPNAADDAPLAPVLHFPSKSIS